MDMKKRSSKRRNIQYFLLPILILVIAFGWKYPLLGFTVLVVTVLGISLSIFNGRHFCGDFCPRGAFFDRILSKISVNKPIPRLFSKMWIRAVLMAIIFSVIMYRFFSGPMTLNQWGMVFWKMCVITTAVGVVLGIAIRPRTWCASCPLGTMQKLIGGKNQIIRISTEKCIDCYACEKACPISLQIVKDKNKGYLTDTDCLKCGECIKVCPKNALSFGAKDDEKKG
jgi:ferredoxin-type protein NapH